MSDHRIPATSSKKEKQAHSHLWAEKEFRGEGRIKNGKYREKSMSEKFKLERELQEMDVAASW